MGSTRSQHNAVDLNYDRFKIYPFDWTPLFLDRLSGMGICEEKHGKTKSKEGLPLLFGSRCRAISCPLRIECAPADRRTATKFHLECEPAEAIRENLVASGDCVSEGRCGHVVGRETKEE